jgi:hypothetical protein
MKSLNTPPIKANKWVANFSGTRCQNDANKCVVCNELRCFRVRMFIVLIQVKIK